jgi:hypothetical protein
MLERFYAKQSHGRTAMRVRSLVVPALIAGGVFGTTLFAQSPSSSRVQTSPRYLPESTASGDLIVPKNFQRMGVRHIATYSQRA